MTTQRRRHGTTLINARGGSRRWTKITADYCRANPVCWLRFPRCTIRSQCIDHYHTRKHRPDLANIPSNWRPACPYCNHARGATPPHLIPTLRAKLEAKAARQKPSKAALRFFG